MKKLNPLGFLCLLLFVCCAPRLTAQNLVLNPSFENSSSCPQGISEFKLCTNWNTTTAAGSDTCSTPDLYAACSSTIGGVNVPNALLGYHQARTGSHFAGIILGDGLPGCVQTGDNYREYIEGQLSSPLAAGTNYLVKFYASLADDAMWGSNSFSVYFSNSLYTHNACPNSIISVVPQLNMCGPAIMDTVNWIPIQWIYTATGGEQYFTIGNFKTDVNTNHVTHNCGSFNPYIYYYIDDVSISTVGPNDCGVTLVTDSVNSTCGTNNGSVSVVASGCTSPFAYSWSTGATTASLPNLPSGTYTVTVTNSSNCHETTSVSVNSKPLTITTTGSNPACGSNNGSASINVSNGTGPYTYLWSNGGTGSSISNLGTGTYYVTVNGATGCVSHDSISLLSSSGLTVTSSTTSAVCGSSNGSATAIVSGGTAPYSFNWSNGATTATISNVPAGTYTVTVVGDTSSGAPFWTEDFTSGGTTWTLNTAGTTLVNGGDANQWIVNSDNTCVCGSGNYLHITCNSSGLSCIGQGGTCTYMALPSAFGNYTTDVLAISPVISTLGKSNIVLSFNWESLGADNTDYGLVKLSNNGGTTWTTLPTQYVDSSNCSLASIAVPIAFQNTANFRIAFEWINAAGTFGGSSGNPPGFVIDNISLTAASSNCPATATVTVPSSSGLTLTVAPTNPSCGIKNGSITATATGAGTISYAWNNGGTAATINNLGPGLYVVTATSSTGCSATASTSLFIGSGNLSANATETDATCGNNNGTATVTASGSSNLTYQWNNNATTASISNLAPGTYTVTVTGSGNCTAIASAVVGTAAGLVLTPAPTATTCGSNNGVASVNVSAGTGPFTYHWNNGSSTQSVSNLAAGTYQVTVSAGGNCSSTASVVIATSTGLSISTTAGRAGCTSSGTATVNVNSGSGPYSYLWSTHDTTSSISSLSAGNYTVTVTGAAGCTATAAATVLSTGSGVTLTASATATSCSSISGSASVTATTGDSPFTYAWSNGGTTASISNIAGGTYTVTVTGNTGCSATATVTVGTTGSLGLTATSTNTSCGNSNGSATANISGGGTYTYLWSNGGTAATISNLAAGTYTVTANSASGCSAIASATVNPSSGTLSIQAQATTICQGDSSQICAPTGYAAYHWNTGSTSQCIYATTAGNYYLTVTDNGNCTITSNHVAVAVNVPNAVTFVQHSDTLIASGSVNYQWYLNGTAISGATSARYIETVDGTYYVQGTDANGCKAKSGSMVIKTPLGIDPIIASEMIRVYPNPLANGSWHLDVSNDWLGSNCEVYDAAGRLVYKTEIKSNQTEFDLNVAQGVYLLRVNTEQKNYAIKLIKL